MNPGSLWRWWFLAGGISGVGHVLIAQKGEELRTLFIIYHTVHLSVLSYRSLFDDDDDHGSGDHDAGGQLLAGGFSSTPPTPVRPCRAKWISRHAVHMNSLIYDLYFQVFPSRSYYLTMR